MPHITIEQADGQLLELDAKAGQSLMVASLTHRLPGILGECGGSLACATCHVYVDPAWVERLPALSELENEMLDATVCARQPTSRLCCQIELTDAMDGLRVSLPESQI